MSTNADIMTTWATLCDKGDDEPQPIFLEERDLGERRAIYAVFEWPEIAMISPNVLRDSPLIAIDDIGVIIITVENGYAAYRLAQDQRASDAITVDLVDAGWSPPPERVPVKNPDQQTESGSLMRFPIVWVSCAVSETRSIRGSRRSSSEQQANGE